MTKSFTNSFLQQTAKDYDMGVHTVKKIAKLCNNDCSLFYEKLEEELKIRRNKITLMNI